MAREALHKRNHLKSCTERERGSEEPKTKEKMAKLKLAVDWRFETKKREKIERLKTMMFVAVAILSATMVKMMTLIRRRLR